METFEEIKILENKYEKLNKKFSKLKILKTKNFSYIEKDKWDFFFVMGKIY